MWNPIVKAFEIHIANEKYRRYPLFHRIPHLKKTRSQSLDIHWEFQLQAVSVNYGTLLMH